MDCEFVKSVLSLCIFSVQLYDLGTNSLYR